MTRKIEISDADGNVLAIAEAKSKAKRFSVCAAADQKQIDSMYSMNAVFAYLLSDTTLIAKFRFVSGKSQLIRMGGCRL